jgi:hypothetical protein
MEPPSLGGGAGVVAPPGVLYQRGRLGFTFEKQSLQ